MYEDRDYVRVYAMKLSLNKFEKNLVDAAAAYKGVEPSAFSREVLMEEVARVLHAANSQRNGRAMERTENALRS